MTGKKFKIIKRNGKVDVEIPDGVYEVQAKITIENGKMKYFDNGVWKKITTKKESE